MKEVTVVMGPFQAIKNVTWNHVFVYGGRSGRSEYWWGLLFIHVMGLLLYVLLESVDNLFFLLILVLAYAYLGGCLLSSGIRRLHDIGRTGAWVLLGFIPFLGSIVLLIMFCFPSKPEENRWGPKPS